MSDSPPAAFAGVCRIVCRNAGGTESRQNKAGNQTGNDGIYCLYYTK